MRAGTGGPRDLALAARQLVVVTGKGGVGKTVLSAALARILSGRGRRVLLLEADPRENLHHLFRVPPSAGEVVRAGDCLALLNASPRAILDATVRSRLKVPALGRKVLASPVYQHFADAAPGLKEMMLLGHALQVTEGEADHEADLVVLDAPASGHALSLLAAPLLVAEVIGRGPLGSMAGRIARLVANPRRCAVVIAALAEEMAVVETLETIDALDERLGRPPELVAVNAVVPPLPDEVPAAAGGALEMWSRRRAAADRALERLSRQWRGDTAVLPLLPHDFGPDLVTALAASLAAQLPEER